MSKLIQIRDYALLLLGVFLVVLIFLFIVLMTPYLLLAAMIFMDWRYVWAIIYSMDRYSAVLISPLVGVQWDGHYTISSECGAQLVDQDAGKGEACRLCRWVCIALDFLDRREPEGHCRHVARKRDATN